MITNMLNEDEAYLAWRRTKQQKVQQSPVDEALTGDHGRQSFAAGMDVREPPEFQEHECWRMMYIWPPDDDGPERVKCSGCEAVGRIEWEYKP